MFLRDISDIRDRVAIVDAYDNRLTYGDLVQMSEEYKRMIPSRSLIMILCDYAIQTVAFYYCQMNNHVVPILVDSKLEQSLLENLIQTYQPEYVWMSDSKADSLQSYITEKIIEKSTHVLAKTGYSSCELHSDVALLMTTSGSTGSPKLVRITYDGIRSNMEAYKKGVGLSEDDRLITTLPMHYCYGLSKLHIHWLAGARVYVTDVSMLNTKFWEFFERSQITNFGGVPYTYEILQKINFFEKEYLSLRFLTQAGAKLPEERQRWIAECLNNKGIEFYLCYGQTEATTYISLLQAEKATEKLGSVGCALDGLKVSIENPDDKGVGELVCQGKSISLGYATDRSMLADEDDNCGILRTGDLAYIDEQGDIFIKGRTKRFIKMLGERVSLDEIEALLKIQYPNNEFACSGEDNILNIYHTGALEPREIQQFCKRKLSLQSKLCFVNEIDTIPRNNAGKILYGKLQKKE